MAEADKTTYYHRKNTDKFDFKQLYRSVVF